MAIGRMNSALQPGLDSSAVPNVFNHRPGQNYLPGRIYSTANPARITCRAECIRPQTRSELSAGPNVFDHRPGQNYLPG